MKLTLAVTSADIKNEGQLLVMLADFNVFNMSRSALPCIKVHFALEYKPTIRTHKMFLGAVHSLPQSIT